MSDDKVLIFGNGRIVNGVANVFKNNWRHTLDFYEYCYDIYDPYHSSDKEKESNGVFSDLSDIDVNNYTIFVIASPTTAHLENLHFVINNYEDKSNIKKIIIEKPLTNELVGDEFLRLISPVRDKLFINYL